MDCFRAAVVPRPGLVSRKRSFLQRGIAFPRGGELGGNGWLVQLRPALPTHGHRLAAASLNRIVDRMEVVTQPADRFDGSEKRRSVSFPDVIDGSPRAGADSAANSSPVSGRWRSGHVDGYRSARVAERTRQCC